MQEAGTNTCLTFLHWIWHNWQIIFFYQLIDQTLKLYSAQGSNITVYNGCTGVPNF